jgi:hypothetical protein
MFFSSRVRSPCASHPYPFHVACRTARLPIALSSPIAQLGRVPGASSASRAARKRADMISSFDELSSHLHTTFSALSTALAKNRAHASINTVYLALVLGPTVGAPKARVILALEGLEVKVCGKREDAEETRLYCDGSRQGEDDNTDDCGSDDQSEASGDSHGDAEEDACSDVTDIEESPSLPPASEPPSSRSPSPLSEGPPLSSPPFPAVSNRTSRPFRPSLSLKSSPSSCASQPYLAPKPTHTRAEVQQTLRAAERLLARTLANAYAEGGGIAAELGACISSLLDTSTKKNLTFISDCLQPRRKHMSCSVLLGVSRILHGSRGKISVCRWTTCCRISSPILASVTVTRTKQ